MLYNNHPCNQLHVIFRMIYVISDGCIKQSWQYTEIRFLVQHLNKIINEIIKSHFKSDRWALIQRQIVKMVRQRCWKLSDGKIRKLNAAVIFFCSAIRTLIRHECEAIPAIRIPLPYIFACNVCAYANIIRKDRH